VNPPIDVTVADPGTEIRFDSQVGMQSKNRYELHEGGFVLLRGRKSTEISCSFLLRESLASGKQNIEEVLDRQPHVRSPQQLVTNSVGKAKLVPPQTCDPIEKTTCSEEYRWQFAQQFIDCLTLKAGASAFCS
jgi:ribosomal protein L19